MSLLGDAFSTYGYRLPLLLVLTLANALFDGLTVAMLLPLLAALKFGSIDANSNIITLTVAWLYGSVGVAITPISIGLLLLLLLAANMAVFLPQAYLSSKLQTAFVAHWQNRFFDTILAAGWPYLRGIRTGDIVGGLTTEAQRLGIAFYQANLIVTLVAFLVIQIAIAALIAPLVTLTLLLLSILLFFLTYRLVRRAIRVGNAMTVANAELFTISDELISAMKLVKATAREPQARRRLADKVARIETLTFSNAFDVQLVKAVFEYTSGATVALLLIVGPLFLEIEVASILIVVAIFIRLFPKVTALRQCAQAIGLALPAYEVLRSMTASAAVAREATRSRGQAIAAGPVQIRLAQVWVRGERQDSILEDVTLDIASGSFVSLVGPTGAGKTTLVDCVLGLVSPTSGQVLIDGMPLQDLALMDWRNAVGYLGQNPVLLSGSLRDNVSWGRKGVDDAEILEALSAADADFALQLPQGLDSEMSEYASQFSGGERQRVALARAILGTPRLLILDEATSALDIETERRIAAVVRARCKTSTVLAITHRMAIARAADVIVMLEGGRIVERGSFAKLQAARGRFASFLQADQSSYATAAADF